MADSNLIATMAQRYSIEPEEFKKVIKATCGLLKATDEEFLAFLMIAHQYDLNPVTKEIYAFVKNPERGGGIQPIVGVDGWFKLMNRHPAANGIDFHDDYQGGQLVSVTAIVYRKDRTHPTEATEYMKECRRNTDPWRQWPARMLRHKAAIQAIRYAYNLAGIMDPDEAERYVEMLRNSQAIDPPPEDLPRPSVGRVSPASGAAAVANTGQQPTPSPQDEDKPPPVAAPPPPIQPEPDEIISEDEWDRLVKMGDGAGLSASKLKHYVEENYRVGDVSELRQSQAAQLKADLKKRAATKK